MTTPTMSLQGAVAVVAGAERGLGPHFVAALLQRGASTVHALSRVPSPGAAPGVVASALDVTDPDAIRAAAARAAEATLIINNDLLATGARLVDGDLRAIDLEMETNFYGALGVIRAFAPVLIANGGGAILDVHGSPRSGAHAVTAAAARAMTDVARAELAPHGIRVAALHVGALPLDDGADRLAALAGRALDELVAGAADIVADSGRIAA